MTRKWVGPKDTPSLAGASLEAVSIHVSKHINTRDIDAGAPVTTQVGQAHALVAPRVDVARVDVLGDMNTDGFQGRSP